MDGIYVREKEMLNLLTAPLARFWQRLPSRFLGYGLALLGTAPDTEMLEAENLIGRTQGIFVCPEGAAPLAAFLHLRRQGWISDDESVVLFNTGSGQVHPSVEA